MLRCLTGLKQLCLAVVNWCNTELSSPEQPPPHGGLNNAEEISNETVCML